MTDVRETLPGLLRTCIECGLCLPHCATYLGTGSEVQSPRGRLRLLGEVLAAESPAPPASFLAAFDQCIGCRACETVCPSGVPYSLLEHGHELADSWGGGGERPVPAVPGPVLRRLDDVGFLRLLATVGGAARAVCVGVLGPTWRQRLAGGPAPVASLSRLLGSLPTSPRTDADLVQLIDRLVAGAGRPRAAAEPAQAAGPTGEIQFFTGCANGGLLPATSRRLLACLQMSGYEVSQPAGQECCGALASHTGRPGRAAGFRRRNRRAFAPDENGRGLPVVVEAAGCALEWGLLGPGFADRVVDPAVLLSSGRIPVRRAVPLKVVFHDPCHARHGRHVTAPPRLLLDLIPGLTWCEASEPEVCCGSGGAWGLRYPELSAVLARRKAGDLAATGADLVVTTNPGCLGQISDGLALVAPEVPVLPLSDLWWYSTRPAGGPDQNP